MLYLLCKTSASSQEFLSIIEHLHPIFLVPSGGLSLIDKESCQSKLVRQEVTRRETKAGLMLTEKATDSASVPPGRVRHCLHGEDVALRSYLRLIPDAIDAAAPEGGTSGGRGGGFCLVIEPKSMLDCNICTPHLALQHHHSDSDIEFRKNVAHSDPHIARVDTLLNSLFPVPAIEIRQNGWTAPGFLGG